MPHTSSAAVRTQYTTLREGWQLLAMDTAALSVVGCAKSDRNALNADPALDFDGNQRFRLNQRECSAIHSPTDQPLLVDELSIVTQGRFRGEINN